jgi:magnesium-transporting ATPase (P-type)
MVDEYFYLLALCHDCVLERDDHGTRYEGESPDEIALVKTAKQMGFMFTGASSGFKNLNVHGETQQIEELMFFPFNSTRKRASVIARLDGVIKLLSKGADSIIIERMAPANKSPQPFLAYIDQKLCEFSKVGLRTLCMAERIISESEFASIQKRFNDASVSPDPKKAIAALAEEVENNLTLIGCSAVEDRLQDEVPETIRDMLKASKILKFNTFRHQGLDADWRQARNG